MDPPAEMSAGFAFIPHISPRSTPSTQRNPFISEDFKVMAGRQKQIRLFLASQAYLESWARSAVSAISAVN